METIGGLIILGIVAFVIYSAGHGAGHKEGKRLGSRKAYGVGFSRGSRSHGGGGGCLLFVTAGLGVIAGLVYLLA
jgi:hypothetical protein